MPPLLETERMILRAPRNNDLHNIYKLGANPQVMRYINRGRMQSMKEAREDLWRRKRSARRRLGYWVAEERSSGAFIGWMALKRLGNDKEVEIGYRFLEEQWGKGFATEGSLEILEYAFRVLRMEKAVAVAMQENRASIRVMEKVGMSFSGKTYDYGADCVRYEISSRRFEQLYLRETVK